MIYSVLLIAIVPCVYGLVKTSSPFRSLINKNPQSITQLHAETKALLDRSATECVNEFFASSGKLPPQTNSHLAAVRIAGIQALENAKLPFSKAEAWRLDYNES
jgi:hypothetical protein